MKYQCQFCKRNFGESGHSYEQCYLEVGKKPEPGHAVASGKLIIRNEVVQARVHEAMQAALKMNLLAQLESQFRYLASYGQQRTECELYCDFAPLSFAFTMFIFKEDGERVPWFSGGLIYEGPNVPANGSAPSFTVSLEPGHGWFVHT